MSKEARKTAVKQTDKKILLYDIETLPIQAYTWTLYPEGLSHENISQDWSIVCAGYKWLGDTKVQSIQVAKPHDDYELCKQLREVIASCSILVGHNSKRFDTKKFNARLIYHKLPPLPNILQVDTLREAKKVASFTSNRLDYLAKIFTGQGKIHTSYSLWLDVIAGSKKALKEMVTYCKEDVNCLERVYLHLRPYMSTHPHIGIMNDHPKESCPKCGSECTKDGIRITVSGGKQQIYKCKSCGGYHQLPFKQTK